MPDRRQKDRRESSTIFNKKLSISLGNFIFLIIIALILICSIIACKLSYAKGYNDALSETLLDTDYSMEDMIEFDE